MAESDSTNELMLAVATALDAWSRIEFTLEGIFVLASGMDGERGCIVMASIVALEARLQVCNNLIRTGPLPDNLKLFYSRFYNKTRKEMKKRNELAHFTIITSGGLIPKEAKLLPYFSLGRIALQVTDDVVNLTELNTANIKERAERFADIGAALRWLHGQMLVEQGKSQENRAPVNDLVQHFLRPDDQNPKENEPQPQP